MTPMREAFVTVVRLIEQNQPERDREDINHWLMLLMESARDAEEAGAAASFASAALIYLEASERSDGEKAALCWNEYDINAHVLTSIMLLRQGTYKIARSSLCEALG